MPPSMRYRSRSLSHFIEPCLPRGTAAPPAEPGWLHEIKHDGFRIMARRDSRGLRLFTRNGYNFAGRFPTIVAAIASLPVRSCLIDGEAIVVDESGLSVFELLRYRHHDHAALLCAFDLIELDGNDLRRTPIEERKDFLAKLLNRPHEGIAFNQHYLCDGARRVVPDEERLSRLLRVILTDQDPQGRR
jgi:bifunctional non-homologous end joining protein LigD